MNNTTTSMADNSADDAKSKLWSLEFGWADYVMTTVAVCLLVAHVSYALYWGPDNFGNKSYFSGVWVYFVFQFAVLIARPSSNTTRIPAVIWIAVGLMALSFNFWFFS